MEMKELKEKRDKIYAIASKYGAKNIRIFGSVATGKVHSDSDIDFLVDLTPGKSLFDLGGLLMDLNNLLECEVDIVTETGLRSRIRNRILKEAILLWEAIHNIFKYADLGKEKFENDELIQNWIVRHLQIIGEASSRLSEEFRNKHSEIPWFKK